jgi:hypothetical protein
VTWRCKSTIHHSTSVAIRKKCKLSSSNLTFPQQYGIMIELVKKLRPQTRRVRERGSIQKSLTYSHPSFLYNVTGKPTRIFHTKLPPFSHQFFDTRPYHTRQLFETEEKSRLICKTAFHFDFSIFWDLIYSMNLLAFSYIISIEVLLYLLERLIYFNGVTLKFS